MGNSRSECGESKYMKEGRDRLLRVDQVCESLNCSKSWVYCLIAEGRLQAVPLGLGRAKRRGLRVLESSVDSFVQAQILAFHGQDE